MALFPLQAILDVESAVAAGWAIPDLARAFLDGGARLVQLRAKQTPSAGLLEWSDLLVEMARPYGADVIVNDRADVARLSGAAGVHVGQDDLPPAAARALVGPGAIVGYSTHTLAQLDTARTEPVTYLAVGPVFGTRTKVTGYEAVGLTLVGQAAAHAGIISVVAIGGITLDTAPSVLRAGAACVAVITDLLATGDPAGRVRAYVRALSGER